MTSDQGRSILQCINQYQVAAPKRRKQYSASEGQVAECLLLGEQSRLLSSSTGGDTQNPHTEKAKTVTTLAPKGTQSNFQTKLFYGRNRNLLIDQRVAHLRANVQQRMHSSTIAPFERFSLQRQAFAWAAQHELAADLRTFSVEHNASGKRSFLVSSYDGFWQRYRDMLPDHRHYYEIVQESYPCHLYFDLEFKKGCNKAVDGEGMVDRLLELIAQQLKAMFIIDMEPAWIVELESDARHKFSRHLVIKIPGKAFANNLHAGCFVNNVCQAAIDPGTGVSSLQVAKEEGTTSIVDTAVYTRNRAFRLYLSSKAGKESILTSTGRFPIKAHSQKQIFMHSLICNVDPDAQLLRCCDDTTHHTQLQTHGRQHGPRSAASSQASQGPSPCPALDAFVAACCNQGGVQGSIRCWVHWDDIRVILYNIKDNRWCGNINRAHKSNGIYVIADMQAGLSTHEQRDQCCMMVVIV
ncbi:hypothetical protein ABBQ32_000488 [Trebouxia sp. C0010 RCD-2024]